MKKKRRSVVEPPIKSVVLYANLDKPPAKRELPHLHQWFRHRGVKILDRSQLPKADAAIALGGDGTILSIAPELIPIGVPVLGINIGRLGFLTASDLAKLYTTLEKLLNGDLRISERLAMSVEAPNGHRRLVLNDCVVKVGRTARVVELSAWINEQYLGGFIGDGLIISTPTGSTAYSLAAGGPVVHPVVEGIILTPICPHSLTQRPIIFPADREVKIQYQSSNRQAEVLVSLDGQHSFPLKPGEEIKVHGAEGRLKIYYNPQRHFFGLLQQKLKWGER